MQTVGKTNHVDGIADGEIWADLLSEVSQHVEAETFKNPLIGMVEWRRSFWRYNGEGFPAIYVGRVISTGGRVIAVHWTSETEILEMLREKAKGLDLDFD